jgi:hypothetical protein
MSLSVLGYMIGKEGDVTTKYNNFKFSKSNNQWATKVDGKQFLFHYHPTQVDSINISKHIVEKINNSYQLYQTSDENSTYKEAIALAQFEILNSLSQRNKYIVNGFTKPSKFSLPVINCFNATITVPVIIFEKSNITEISEENNCIFLRARSESDMISIKDRLLYGILGIIA